MPFFFFIAAMGKPFMLRQVYLSVANMLQTFHAPTGKPVGSEYVTNLEPMGLPVGAIKRHGETGLLRQPLPGFFLLRWAYPSEQLLKY